MHDVMTGYFDPNAYDISVGILDGFGATTNIINGGLECDTGIETSSSLARAEYYSEFCKDFGVNRGLNLGCENMGPFTS